MVSYSLADFVEIDMGQSPPGETCNTSGEGVPLLNGPTEFGPHHPTPVQFTLDPRRRARVGDILFCVRGATIGRMNWADQEYAIGRGIAAIRHRTTPQLQPFVRAVVEYNLPRLLAQATGSTFPNVSRDQLACLPWPPLTEEEQRAIAHILGTLDDKIELNRRMSETLEAIARALFESWFVRFDPVRAKMEGRDPGLPPDLAALFPDRLVDSGLGEIPEGWDVLQLGSLASIKGGKQLPPEECLSDGAYPVFGANGIMGFAERPTHPDFVIAFGRVGANCGSIHWSYSGAWINNNASSIIPVRWPEYVLAFLLAADFEPLRTGSAQPFIPNSSLASMPVLRPSDSLLDVFCRTTHTLRIRQHILAEESRTLAALRDTLLPKLISGELRVKDAERLVAAAT